MFVDVMGGLRSGVSVLMVGHGCVNKDFRILIRYSLMIFTRLAALNGVLPYKTDAEIVSNQVYNTYGYMDLYYPSATKTVTPLSLVCRN